MTSYVYYAFVGFFYFMVASASFAGAPLPSDQYNFMMAVKSCLNEAPIDGLCSIMHKAQATDLCQIGIPRKLQICPLRLADRRNLTAISLPGTLAMLPA